MFNIIVLDRAPLQFKGFTFIRAIIKPANSKAIFLIYFIGSAFYH